MLKRAGVPFSAYFMAGFPGETDDDFDWTPINDTNNQSFHITAVNPGCVYYRAWMWNANLPWHFKHDLAHECIVCDIEGVGEAFQRYDLPNGMRQVGTNDGESYTVPTKYFSDAFLMSPVVTFIL